MKNLFSASNIVIFNSIVFIMLCLYPYFWPGNQTHSGGDAAGNAISSGYSALYKLLFLLVVALIISVVNFFLSKQITAGWIKFLGYLPMVITAITFCFVFLEPVERYRSFVDANKQRYIIHYEYRSLTKLDNAVDASKDIKGRSFNRLSSPEKNENYYVYTLRNGLRKGEERKFWLEMGDSLKTSPLVFNIMDNLDSLPISDWQVLEIEENVNPNDKVIIEFRYRIEKFKSH